MMPRSIILAGAALAGLCLLAPASKANEAPPAWSYDAPMSGQRAQLRPPAEDLPVPLGYTREQIVLGDRVFHGEAAGGTCYVCHGMDARGTANGNDLSLGFFIWGDGSVKAIKKTIFHNMEVVPGRDGDLTPDDVDAVSAYLWALGRSHNR